MTSIYKKAIQQKLRFKHKGVITTEDLWSLSLKDLDALYKSINAELKAADEESLLETKSPETETLKLQIEILKDVVETKIEDRKAAEKRRADSQERKRILKAIEDKAESKYDNMSEEELHAALDNLDK